MPFSPSKFEESRAKLRQVHDDVVQLQHMFPSEGRALSGILSGFTDLSGVMCASSSSTNEELEWDKLVAETGDSSASGGEGSPSGSESYCLMDDVTVTEASGLGSRAGANGIFPLDSNVRELLFDASSRPPDESSPEFKEWVKAGFEFFVRKCLVCKEVEYGKSRFALVGIDRLDDTVTHMLKYIEHSMGISESDLETILGCGVVEQATVVLDKLKPSIMDAWLRPPAIARSNDGQAWLEKELVSYYEDVALNPYEVWRRMTFDIWELIAEEMEFPQCWWVRADVFRDTIAAFSPEFCTMVNDVCGCHPEEFVAHLMIHRRWGDRVVQADVVKQKEALEVVASPAPPGPEERRKWFRNIILYSFDNLMGKYPGVGVGSMVGGAVDGVTDVLIASQEKYSGAVTSPKYGPDYDPAVRKAYDLHREAVKGEQQAFVKDKSLFSGGRDAETFLRDYALDRDNMRAMRLSKADPLDVSSVAAASRHDTTDKANRRQRSSRNGCVDTEAWSFVGDVVPFASSAEKIANSFFLDEKAKALLFDPSTRPTDESSPEFRSWVRDAREYFFEQYVEHIPGGRIDEFYQRKTVMRHLSTVAGIEKDVLDDVMGLDETDCNCCFLFDQMTEEYERTLTATIDASKPKDPMSEAGRIWLKGELVRVYDSLIGKQPYRIWSEVIFEALWDEFIRPHIGQYFCKSWWWVLARKKSYEGDSEGRDLASWSPEFKSLARIALGCRPEEFVAHLLAHRSWDERIDRGQLFDLDSDGNKVVRSPPATEGTPAYSDWFRKAVVFVFDAYMGKYGYDRRFRSVSDDIIDRISEHGLPEGFSKAEIIPDEPKCPASGNEDTYQEYSRARVEACGRGLNKWIFHDPDASTFVANLERERVLLRAHGGAAKSDSNAPKAKVKSGPAGVSTAADKV